MGGEGGGEGDDVEWDPVEARVIQEAPPANITIPTEANNVKTKRRLFCTVENCGYSTPFSKDLARHMRKHTGEKPFKCDRCEKCYSRYDKLTLHLRAHTNQKPFKCGTCNYAAIDSGSLRKHLRVHNDERPYKCQVCPYAAKESSQLVVHLRGHTGDSPYICMDSGCDAAFKTPSDLKRHSRIHSGQKPFACPRCNYKSAVKSNLNSHLRKVHKEITAKNTRKGYSVPTVKRNKLKLHFEAEQSPVKQTSTRSEVTEEQQYVSNVCGEEFTSAIPAEEAPIKDVDVIHTVQVHLVEQESSVPYSALHLGRTEGATEGLPYDYACKQCPFRTPNFKQFASHLKMVHDSGDSGLPSSSKVIPAVRRPVGRPRCRRIIRDLNELETFFHCSFCGVSFVRKDSLRCHMRQHSTPAVSVVVPTSEINPGSFSTSTNSRPHYLNFLNTTRTTDGLFTSSYPNLNFNATEKTDPHTHLGVSSVITENPRHIFLVTSPVVHHVEFNTTSQDDFNHEDRSSSRECTSLSDDKSDCTN